jgi:hypothetical protein
MRKLTSSAIACLCLLGGGSVTGLAADELNAQRAQSILAFRTMYGVDGPFVGANPIRDVIGDELPWEIAKSRGRLDSNGHLMILVRGLVFKDDPSVPPELRGTNDETEFRGLVSCLTEEGDKVVTKNVATEGFPATPDGNSLIRAEIELPNPCVAPIVMVLAGSEDKWFAVTGFEAEEE